MLKLIHNTLGGVTISVTIGSTHTGTYRNLSTPTGTYIAPLFIEISEDFV